MASNTLILILTFVFDIVALALAVIAAGISTGRTVHHRGLDSKNDIYCAYDLDAASGLGIGAFVLLLVSRILIASLSQCLCCRKRLRPSCAWISAIVLCILCWITFFIAELFLFAGFKSAKDYKLSDPVSCSAVRKAVFGIAAVFILFTAIFSQLYYFCYKKANVKPLNQREGDVAAIP